MYVDEHSLHEVLRHLFHDNAIHNRTLEALLTGYRRTGADELEMMRWTKANRTRIAESIGWIPENAEILTNKTHEMILTPPDRVEVLNRDLAA